jgi:hypothetical protein
MDQRVTDLAGRQIEVGLFLPRDRVENIFEACLLAEHREVVGLPGFEPRRDCHRLDVVHLGNGDVETDGDRRFGYNPSLAMDGRIGVAVVGGPLERDVAQPSRRLAAVSDTQPVIRVRADFAILATTRRLLTPGCSKRASGFAVVPSASMCREATFRRGTRRCRGDRGRPAWTVR